MVLVSDVKYETRIKEISPEAVLSILSDIKVNIGRLESSFAEVDLARVLAVVEEGKYEIKGDISIRIDLSSAKSVINAYRRDSEGGCKSCVGLGRETIDAQDTTAGWYCRVSDSAFNVDRGVCYSGFSPKVNTYYNKPCDSWKPKMSPKLEELISKER